MWSTVLIFLQIFKIFLELWKTKDEKEAAVKASKAKDIVDAFATADPKERASKLNNTVQNIMKS